MINDERQWPLVFLGWLTLTVTVATSMEFVLTRNAFKFGEPQWIASLIFILVLLAVGFGFLFLGKDQTSLIIWGVLLGIAAFATNLCLYLFVSYMQLFVAMTVKRFMGLTILFLLSFSIGPLILANICSRIGQCERLKLVAYVYGAMTLSLIFGMTLKYVFVGVPVDEYILIETMILGMGTGIFFYFYTKSNVETVET